MKYLINDLSKLFGISTNAIRRYEKDEFISPERDSSNYRKYGELDIIKLSMIRLYVKCGFSHSEIKKMLGAGTEEIEHIYESHIEELDNRLRRIKLLRHWLKDNKELIENTKNLEDGFFIMNCPAVRYIIYSEGEKLLKDKERGKTIKDFLYEVPEVQLIQLLKYEDLKNNRLKHYRGWAVKEMDIEKYCLQNIVEREGLVIKYPSSKCLYSSLFLSAGDVSDKDITEKKEKEHIEKILLYAKSIGLEPDGDIMQFIVTALGDSIGILSCVPVKNSGPTEQYEGKAPM